jgi:predicted lipoprotein with Yx(FWY)xxD motif
MTDEDIGQPGYERVIYRKLPAPPPENGVQLSLIGDVYTDKAGRTLYTFACQTQGCDLPGAGAAAMSALCSTGQECMRRWRPYLAGPNARPSGGWTVVDVPQPMFTDPAGQLYPAGGPTVKGWAYRGKPVFTFYEDKQPGDVWGITVRWFNASPTFQPVRPPGTPGAGGRF